MRTFGTCIPFISLVPFGALWTGRALDAGFTLGALGAFRSRGSRIALVSFRSLTA